MESVVNSFIKLVKTFKDSPVSFLIVILVTIGVYMLYSQTEYIVSLLPDPAKESEQFQLSLERDLVVNQALDNSREFFNAQSIAIAQFHNGQYDLTRLPFTKISVTYYRGNSGLSVEDVYTTRPLSTMNKSMLEMWKDKDAPTCVAYMTEDIPDEAYRRRVENSDMAFVSLCPLTNVLNYPIGYMAVAYSYKPMEEEIPVLMDYQKGITLRIAGYLQDGVVRERT